jgi:hypothetical protein
VSERKRVYSIATDVVIALILFAAGFGIVLKAMDAATRAPTTITESR